MWEREGVVGVRDRSIDCDWLIVEWGNLYYEGFCLFSFLYDWDLRDVWDNTFDSTEDGSAFHQTKNKFMYGFEMKEMWTFLG